MTRSTPDREEMTRCCLREVAQILQRPESVLDPTAKFTRLGLDSAMSVQLVVALEEKLGFELARPSRGACGRDMQRFYFGFWHRHVFARCQG